MSGAARAALAVLRNADDLAAAEELIMGTTPLTWPQSFGTLAWTLTAFLTDEDDDPPADVAAGWRLIGLMRSATTETMESVKASLILGTLFVPAGAAATAAQLLAIAWEVERKTGGALSATYEHLCDDAEVIAEAEQVISVARTAEA